MGRNKDFNPNELDSIQEAYNKSDEMEKKEAKYRKEANIKKRNDESDERLELNIEIIKKYGSYDVKEEHLIKKGMLSIQVRCCMSCHQYKIYPYEYLTARGSDNDKSNCSICMHNISRRVKKYKNKNEDEKIDCPCGKCVYPSDLIKHNDTLSHINGVAQLKIKGLNKIVKAEDMRKIAKDNKILNYQSLKIETIIKELQKLDVVIIPLKYQ
jgi:hypothetical protein